MTTGWDGEPKPHYDTGYREEQMERSGTFSPEWEYEHRQWEYEHQRVLELEAQLREADKKAGKKKGKHTTKVIVKLGGGTSALVLFVLVFFFHISWFWFFVLLLLFLFLG